MKIFFAGEGPDELGEWGRDRAYQPRASQPAPRGGLLHALVRGFAPEHVTGGAARWREIRKFRAGNHAAAETRNVLGLALETEEQGCDALVFVRDRDRDVDREHDVEAGIASAEARFAIRIVGGTANEEIEAWLLAMKGEPRSERHANAKTVLRERYGIDNREEKIGVIDGAVLDRTKLPDGGASLHRWLERAEARLGVPAQA